VDNVVNEETMESVLAGLVSSAAASTISNAEHSHTSNMEQSMHARGEEGEREGGVRDDEDDDPNLEQVLLRELAQDQTLPGPASCIKQVKRG
jgi:hypothetical protein